MQDRMQVGGIVLCGGESRRMGLAKATLPFGSELMLQRVVRLLSEVVEPIVVVAAADQTLPKLPRGVLRARDHRSARGPLEGLYAGLVALQGHADAAYASSCDVPLLAPAFVRKMIDQLDEHDIAVPKEDRFYHPLAAVYRIGVVDAVRQLLDEDRLRPAFLFDAVDTLPVPVTRLRSADPHLDTLTNLNRPQDYLNALAVAGFTAPPDVLEKLAPRGD